MKPDVVPVTWDRWVEFETFFAAHAPQCFCRWPRFAPMSFIPGDPSNRGAMRDLIASGNCPGLLALIESHPVGWCAVGPMGNYPQYADVAQGGWAIACVLVAPEARGKGVGRALVQAAVEYAAENRATLLYGPPPWWRPDGEDLQPALVHVLKEYGFQEVADGARMPVLRRRLNRS